MTLGFSVDALVAQGRGGAALRMGLTRIAQADWLRPDPDLRTRAATFDTHPDAVLTLAGSEDAGREVAALVGVEGGLAQAARSIWEDLCILQPVGPGGAYRLTAGAVAFPTDWHLADKMGHSLAAIHAPIHGYAEQLSAGVDHLFATLTPGMIVARANWFVVPVADWRYLPTDDPADRFAHVTAANAGWTLFVRCERQTLRRLPRTGAMLFTIGIAVARLDTLGPATVRRVAAGVVAQPEDERERRAAPFYAAALASYAADDRSALLEPS